MNVVLLCDFAHAAGGAERVAIDSAVALQAAGHQVHFVAGGDAVDDALAASGVAIHLVGAKDLRRKSTADLLVSGLWSGRARAALESLLARLPRLDTVIHAHSWQRALTASTLHAAQRSGFPLVVTLHEYGLACPNQGFYDYQAQRICERKALGADCLTTHCDTRTYAHKLWRTARVVLQRGVVGIPRDLRHVIFLSQLSKQVLAPYFGPRTHWHSVRNPISIPQMPRAVAEKNGSFLFVGRVSREKGADLFAAASATAGIRATIAGDGPELAGLRARYRALTYLGWVEHNSISSELRNARALVFPSVWYETQGMVVQEALACGVPVIVSSGTAAREFILDGESGLIFSHMDSSDLSRCLIRLANDDPFVESLSRRAYSDYWRDPPTVAHHLETLTAVYRKSLQDDA